MSELRIGLIMGGGVSLGSFSAGALTRLIRLLRHVERGPAKIDVVTGASAGSMTLGVVLYHLFRGSSIEKIEASLRSAWVDRICFDALCPDLSTHASASLFSDGIVRSIANQELDFRVWDDNSEPHPYFAEGTLASFALTNLNGIPVRAEGQLIRQATGGTATGPASVFADAVQTTYHDDALRFCLRRTPSRSDFDADRCLFARTLTPWSTPESRDAWGIFREAAIASGAFPAAFPPVRIRRHRSEFAIWPDELERDEFTFDYVDGGVLRNEPLREAIELARVRDEGLEVERVFILIDPHASGTRELYPLSFNQALAMTRKVNDSGDLVSCMLDTPTYMSRLSGVLGRLLSVLMSQSTFRDWLKTARVNSQVEWRDDLLKIVDQLEPRPGSGAEAELDSLLEKIYLAKSSRGVTGSDEGAAAGEIRERIDADLARRTSDGTPAFTTKLHLLVDLVAGLRDKRKLNMVAITPASVPGGRPIPIAGNFLSNFGGFFNESYRVYDFAAGEYVASEVLTTRIPGALPFLEAGVAPAPRPAPPIPDPSYRGLSQSVQQRFETLVGDHSRAVASMIGLPSILHGLFAGKVRGKVHSALMAEDGGTVSSFVVRIRGANKLFARASPSGSDLAADGNGGLQTIVNVRRGGDGTAEIRLSGPHLLTDGEPATAEIELRRRRLLRSSRRVAVIRLTGSAEDWDSRSRYSSIPLLVIDLAGREEVTVTPLELLAAGEPSMS